ncbi:MAG: hypothetical protein U1E26_08350 [Coriobacteriia bacterium]|nr:hypothetical protein [Coriobacteriia bacterium]
MRAFVCFDDTDNLGAPRGTGKLVRWYEDELPDGCKLWGVVRQQLLVHPDIPYTSHNSSACAVVEVPDAAIVEELITRAIAHVELHALEGSDPGVCVALEDNPAIPVLTEFGRRAAVSVVTQADAIAAASGAHLSGHGGTNDGIIGAAAGVGLTAWGWSGRFVEFGRLRDHPAEVTVGELEAAGMLVLPVDRNVVSPKLGDIVETADWLRPRLWGGRPAVPVMFASENRWLAIGKQPSEAPGQEKPGSAPE